MVIGCGSCICLSTGLMSGGSEASVLSREKRAGAMDRSRPSCSVRMDESGSGYFFVSAYERGLSFPDFHDVRVQINCGEKQFSLPPVDIKAGSLFFYPFHLSVAGVDFDYVLAQPIAKVAQGEQTICYFMEIPGIAPSLSASGRSHTTSG